MNSFEGDESIAVGSTGTLLSLIGKEMEVLQARKSCSVSSYGDDVMSKRSPSAKWDYQYNTYSIARNVYESPAPSYFHTSASSTSAASIVSSLWSDLKGLLRSPTSNHHTAPQNAHQYHNAIFVCREDIMDDGGDDEHVEQLNDVALLGKKFPVGNTYLKEKCPAVVVDSLSRKSKQSRLKGKEKWHCTAAPRSLMDDISNFPAYRSRRAVDLHAAASTSARNSYVAGDGDHTRKGKLRGAELGKEKAASRKSSSYSTTSRRREGRIFCKMQQAEERRDECEGGCSCTYCMQQMMMQKEVDDDDDDDDDELGYAYGDHGYHTSSVIMQRPLMALRQAEEPNILRACHHNKLTSLLKLPSRSSQLVAGGRWRSNVGGVSVVDLQCCHSSTPSCLLISTPTTARLSFTRLSHS